MRTKKTYITLWILFVSGLTYGQETISLSIENNKLKVAREKYNKIKKGEFFIIKINGINTYLYDVSINNEDKTTTEKLPSNVLSLLDFGGLTSSLTNLNSVSDIVKTLPETKEVDSLQNMVSELNNIMLDLNYGEMNFTPPTLPEILESANALYQSEHNAMIKRRTNIESHLFKIQDYQSSILTSEKNLLYDVPNTTDIKNSLETYKKLKNEVVVNGATLSKLESSILAIPNVYEKELKDSKEHSLYFEKLKNINDKLKEANVELEKLMSLDNYSKISSSLTSIINNNAFEYKSLPIQHYEDINEIKITIKPRDEKAQLPSYSATLRIPDYQKTFWGVSTGFYITKNLEENYSIVERMKDGETVFDLVEEDNSSEELGINTMVRYGVNISGKKFKNIFWQFGFGAGITINDKVKPRLLVGTGPAFGGKNKFFIDFGLIYVYHDKLSNVYELDGNTTQPENFLVNSTNLNGYISLGYLIKLN